MYFVFDLWYMTFRPKKATVKVNGQVEVNFFKLSETHVRNSRKLILSTFVFDL